MSQTPVNTPVALKRWMLPLPLLLLAPFVVPIPEVLDKIYILRTLGGLFHFVLPGLLTVFFYRVAVFRGRLIRSMLLAFALAAGAELLQSQVGRHPRFIDAGIDLSGVLFSAGVLLRRDGRRRGLYLPLLFFILVIPLMFMRIPENISARYQAVRRFPVIADFDDHTDEVLWSLSRDDDGSFWFANRYDDPGRVICLSGGPQDEWPGIKMQGVPRDWTGWDTLVFEAVIIKGDPVQLVVRIEDYHGNKDNTWCFTHVKLDRSWRKYAIDLTELTASLESRIFRLDDLSMVVLYLVGVETGSLVCIDNMALERKAPQ